MVKYPELLEGWHVAVIQRGGSPSLRRRTLSQSLCSLHIPAKVEGPVVGYCICSFLTPCSACVPLRVVREGDIVHKAVMAEQRDLFKLHNQLHFSFGWLVCV